MTRVNLVPVDELMDQHLMAEYREIPMVMGSLARTLRSKKGLVLEDIPKKFTLNKGHVKFFYNKGLWLRNRYEKCIVELTNRGYQIQPELRLPKWEVFINDGWYEKLYNDWKPTKEEIEISRERIELRISEKPNWYRKTI